MCNIRQAQKSNDASPKRRIYTVYMYTFVRPPSYCLFLAISNRDTKIANNNLLGFFFFAPIVFYEAFIIENAFIELLFVEHQIVIF